MNQEQEVLKENQGMLELEGYLEREESLVHQEREERLAVLDHLDHGVRLHLEEPKGRRGN